MVDVWISGMKDIRHAILFKIQRRRRFESLRLTLIIRVLITVFFTSVYRLSSGFWLLTS
jgi:hypothetical protein